MTTPLIVGGAARLKRSEELALNELLRRNGGELGGRALWQVRWAADDNAGLARQHVCGKSDPWDWTRCACPRDEFSVPLCFHENQLSYHLLSYSPPNLDMMQFQREMREDLTKGTYACLQHFVDPRTGVAFSPTHNIIEVMVPLLRQMREIGNAADHGYNATVDQLRVKRAERDAAEQKKKDRAYDTYADAMLEDAMPSCITASSGLWKKTRAPSDILLTDHEDKKTPA